MGDAENAVPPSLKRAADRELSRDNPGEEDEEDVCDQEAGTFKKASEEVLANRRIVKVRRNRTPSIPSAPSSNPFASIQLVPPTNSTSTPVTVTNVQESQDNMKKEEAGGKQEPESKVVEVEKHVVTNVTDTDVEESKDNVKREEDGGNQEPESKVVEVEKHEVTNVTDTGVQESKDNVKKEEDGGNQEPESKVVEVEKHEVTNVTDTGVQESQDNVKKEEDCGNQEPESKVDEVEKPEVASEASKPESAAEGECNTAVDDEKKNVEKAASVTSFQQLSSSQNAFTGIVGTGFSGSTFSFGSITKGDQPSFPPFSFGTNGNSSLFGTVCDKTEGIKTPSINKVEVETGEENERVVFTADSVLFEFLDGGWKERGKGELKVNVSTTGNEKGRLVMRAKGNYRLILNASLFPDMKLTNMEKKGITFACLNSTGEGKDGLSTFALRFKDSAIVEEFRAVVTRHKGNHTNTAVPVASLKTPENSPKASDG